VSITDSLFNSLIALYFSTLARSCPCTGIKRSVYSSLADWSADLQLGVARIQHCKITIPKYRPLITYGDESSAMPVAVNNLNMPNTTKDRTRMWANAQRDGRRAEYRWRPLFNAAVWLKPTTRVQCSDAAKTRIPLKLAGVFQTPEPSSAVSGPKFIIL